MKKVIKAISKQEERRIKAKSLLKAKQSPKKISKQVSISERTVEKLKGRRTQRKKGPGRRAKLNRSSKLSIRNMIKANPYLTPRRLIQRLNLDCSVGTVRTYLKECGFTYRNPCFKEPLSPDQRKERVDWRTEWRDFEDFDQVIFTDETGYWLDDTRGKGWFPTGQSFDAMEVESSEKLNIWAAISIHGKVALHIFDNNLDALTYREILRNSPIPAARPLYPDGFILQRDNLKVHSAGLIKKFLVSREADVIEEELPWPSYSSDLNPIENLWAILKRNIRKRRPQTLEGLREIIQEEWNNIRDAYARRLCHTIRKRITMCIEKEGTRIKY